MTKPLSKQLIRGASLLFTAMAFSSCSQTQVEKQEAVSALESGRWRQVAKKPPTYYPKGVAEDHLTGASDGYWVYRGDKAGTRFFIPSHGVRGQSGDALIAEALAAATPERKKKIEEAEKKLTMQERAGRVVSGALLVLAAYDYPWFGKSEAGE